MENTKEAYFNIDARILFQLGEQLVTDRAVALAELVKNAYDADASIVKIFMDDIKSTGGSIIIEDNGEGINSLDFEEKWMRIATIDKEMNPISKKYGRKKAGEKGIGRFACRRLSKKLYLKSVTINSEGEKELLSATFNWDNFKPGDDLIKVPIKYSAVIVSDDEKVGTKLFLRDLHDIWNKEDIKKLRLELVDLFTPDTFIRHKKTSDEEDDPGFNVEFKIKDFPDKSEDLDRSFYKNAWAELQGEIDEEGKAIYQITYLNTLTKKKETRIFNRYDNYGIIKNVEFKCYVLSYRKDLFGSSDFGINKAQTIGRERGGIKVYSDNFRIFGYGRAGDDWLRVDYDRGRSIENLDEEAMEYKSIEKDRPGLRLFQNRNLFGHVLYDKDSNPSLQITINRDSLVQNDAYEELRHFTRLGIDFATVLYSNLVYKEQQYIKEQEKHAREIALKAALEEKQKLEEEKRKAEEKAKQAEAEKKLAEERALKAEIEKKNAEEAARKAEEERRNAEEARRNAEAERKKAEDSLSGAIEEKIKEEEAAKELEKEKIKQEEYARQREQEARKRAEEEYKKAQEEWEKQRKIEEEVEKKRKQSEEDELKRREEELRRKEKELEDEKVLLRVLASTGTMILIFQHELQGFSEEMETVLINFRKTIAGKNDVFLENMVNDYYLQLEMLKEMGALMGSIIDRESRFEKKDWVLLPIVNAVSKPFSYYLNEIGAKLTPEVPDALRTPIMYRSEVISILHNLITNSIKAIKNTRNKQIKIQAIDLEQYILIRVLDTGIGLDKDKWEEVFLPFTGYSEPDLRFGTGTGLGLKIVRDMARSYGGDVKFIVAPDDWVTCVEIVLPKNQ